MRKTNGRGLLPCIPKLNFLTIKYIFGGGGGVVFAFIFVIYIILLSLRYIYIVAGFVFGCIKSVSTPLGKRV